MWDSLSETWDIQPSLKTVPPLLIVSLSCAVLADLWERVEEENGGLQEHQPLSQSPAAARGCLHLGTQAEDPRSLPAQALPQAQEAAVAGVCLVPGTPTRFPQNGVGLTPPSSLLLPPLASLCLLTLCKFCFPCFESVPSVNHGLRSPASLAPMLSSLSAQPLLTMTPVAKESQSPFSSLGHIREWLC